MTRVLNLFNQKKNPYVQAQGVNYEGFPSFQRSWQEGYLQVLLTNTLGGTFYAESHDLLQDSLALHQEAAQKDPTFMAQALVYARQAGLMRLQPIVGLVYLSKANRDLFHKVFARVILTPGDLSDFVEILRGDVVPGGMGRSVKRAINAWLNGMSEYHAIKYGTGGQGYSLRDILRVSHPQPLTDLQDAIFMWLTDREKWQASEKHALTPQISAFEAIKRLDLSLGQAAARQLITDGKLPYEVVTGVIQPDLATWESLMRQMPYLALLRHLNTLQRAEVFKVAENIHYVADRLSKREAIAKAKVLPFQLYTAYQMFKVETPTEQAIKETLASALEHSFINMPALDGKICISPDVSSSMSGRISAKNTATFVQVAGIFTGALFKKSAQALVLPFDTEVKKVNFNRQDSLMSIAEGIAKLVHDGTALSAPISELLAHKTKIDVFIGITDNVEWAQDQHGNHGFLPTWNEYKAKVAPQAQAFLLTIAPYRLAVAPQHTPDVHYIYGWSDSVLKYISLTLQGLAGQVEAVQGYEI